MEDMAKGLKHDYGNNSEKEKSCTGDRHTVDYDEPSSGMLIVDLEVSSNFSTNLISISMFLKPGNDIVSILSFCKNH